jgi:outer membrane immunogenic protein
MPPPPPRAPAAYIPVAPPMYNWGGIYIGLNGGYGFGKSTWTVPAADTGPGNISTNGPLVGGTLGANFQTGQFVFGIEGDGDWSNIKGSASGTTSATCLASVATSCTYQTTNTWLATLRARMGVAWDRVLIYGTAGGAGGNIGANFSGTGLTTATSSSSEFGWTAGGGLEFGITDNVTAKVEYLYVDLQNGSFSCPVATCGGAAATTGPVSFTTSLVRAGLNLKFNPF